ncbi:GTPase IMAP family member 9-like isoform X2 [Mytilus edulis]|uniref:GTPase IMAP family member 9-like isoform X2 n=1 Tax=Mytilus edulis TaxID=6550 RepID=UPI0039EDF345
MGILSCKSSSSTVLDVVHVKKTTQPMLDKKEVTVFPEPTQGTIETDYPEPTQETLTTKDASCQTPEVRRSTRVVNGRLDDEIESDSDERDVILVRRREASSQTPERQSFITSSMQEERDEDSALRSRSQCQSVATPKKIEILTEEDEETEFGLVLIGQTGSGKSSVGNMIIGSDVFGRKVVNVLDTSYTQIIKCMDQKIGSKRFFVVDTPGIPVINKNTERQTVLQLIQSAKQEVQDTPYAFLLVVSLDKYLSPELINFLQNRCDDIFDRLVVVFTCGNNQEIDDNSLLSSVSNELRKFIKNNNLKFIKLNCNYSKLDCHLDVYTKRKVMDLLQKCENSISKHSRFQNLAEI